MNKKKSTVNCFKVATRQFNLKNEQSYQKCIMGRHDKNRSVYHVGRCESFFTNSKSTASDPNNTKNIYLLHGSGSQIWAQ